MTESNALMEHSSSENDQNPAEDTEQQAENLQQFYYECFGDRDWDAYSFDEHVFLKRNIGFAIFGNPGDQNSVKNNSILDTTTGYNKSQNKQINEVYAAIMKNHYLKDTSVVLIRTIFICCVMRNKKKSLFVEPVFVVKKCHNTDNDISVNNCTIFIDSSARVYQSWELYMENNKLPKCLMVVPKNGRYCGEILDSNAEEVKVIIEKLESPACSIGSQILDGADIAGTLASIGTTAVFAVAAIPSIAVAPVVLTGAAVTGAAVGLYSVGRSAHTLVDRSKHDQSIGLDNAESRWCWLNTTVGILGASASAATGLLTRAASKGVEIGQTARIAFNTLNGANIVGSAANLGLSGYHIIDKLINDERPSPFEVFQFASSILFFHLSVVNFRTASTIISETQSTTIINYEKTLRSNRHRKLFRKAQLEARRLNGEAKGNAEIIKGIRNINDPDNFFAGLARINKDLNKNNARYTITTDGKVQINSNYIIDPMEFAQISKDARGNILKTIPPYDKTPNAMSKPTFDVKTNFIMDHCQKVLPSSGLMINILKDILSNKVDIETMSLLLQKYTDRVTEYLLDVLLAFLREISDSLDDFSKLHPYVSLPVGALQYLINYVESMARDLAIELKTLLQTFFDANNSVNREFLYNLKEKFETWIKEKIDLLKAENDATAIDIREKNKKRKDCEKCCGFFYETQ